MSLSLFQIAEAFIDATSRSNDEIAELISLSTVSVGTSVLASGQTVTINQFDLTDQANLQIFQAKISVNNIINQTATNTISAFANAAQTVASKIA